MKKVLILGGGIAGIETTIWLRKYGFNVHLISNRDFMFIYPISIWIPTKEKKFEDVIIPLKDLSKTHNFSYEIDNVEKINSNIIYLRSGKKLEKGKDFDYLIIALGQDKLKLEGIEHTYSICTSPEEIIRYSEALEKVISNGTGKLAFGFGGNPKAKEAVRGGPVFEELFNIDNLLRKRGIREKFELIFFAPMEKPGARLGEKALKMLDIMFEKKRIQKVVGKKIKKFTKNSVILEDNSEIESDLTLFVPAGTGHPAVKNSDDLPKTEVGFLKIKPNCEVEDFEYIYGIGDSVALDGPEWRAKQGHLAEVMARITAYNIALKEQLEKGNPKTYTEHLNIMCLMDTGNGGALAYRDSNKAMLIPLPIIGHWIKKGWGAYYKLSKLGKIPRLPGI